MSVVNSQIQRDVAVITVDNPPMNAMSMAVRAELRDAVLRAAADEGVIAAVIIGANGTFIPGADIREFGKPITGPSGRDVIAAIEACNKPVVAALAGNALGGGLEVALGCHWRVATPSVKLGLPEVNLGLIPGAGGTQRLTRLAGPAAALDLITGGRHIDGRQGLALGIVDELADDPLLEHALAFARRIVAENRPLRIAGAAQDKIVDIDPALFTDIRKKNEKKWRGQIAPWKIVDCIEAACTQSFEQAYCLELSAYEACKASPQRAALTYLFSAEREAARIPGLPPEGKSTATQPGIRCVAVIGAGTMGGGIAMSLANAGVPVTLLEMTPEALARGRGLIEKNYAASVSRGSLTQEKVDQALSLITGTLAFADIADNDLVIEAVFEDMATKQDVFRKLDATMKPGAILATNTSTLDIDQIAAVTTRPEAVIGAHFFSPANVMKLLEVVRGSKTSPATITATMALAKSIGKVAVLAGNCDGFIGNRILAVYGRECDFLLEEGATPSQIDRALQGFGFPMGLYLMRDMAGLDVGWRIRKYRAQFRPQHLRYSPIADRLCELGRFGQKTGMGYYRYEGRNATPDPEVEALIDGISSELGLERKPVTDAEIVDRVLCAMANEGARIVGEGVALRASDVDVTYVFGYGFPRHQGGPMFWAEQQGLSNVYERVRGFQQRFGEPWTPAPLLEQLARSGGGWKDPLKAAA